MATKTQKAVFRVARRGKEDVSFALSPAQAKRVGKALARFAVKGADGESDGRKTRKDKVRAA